MVVRTELLSRSFLLKARNWPLNAPRRGLPSLCVFDLTGATESALIGLDSTYRLKDFFWVDEARLIFRFGMFERLQTQSGMQEFEAWRAVSYDVNSGESTVLMNDTRGMVDTSNIVSLLPQDEGKVLIMGWIYDSGATSGTIMPTKSNKGWMPRTFAVNLKNGKTRKAETFPKHTDQVVFDQYGREVARLRRDINLGTSTVYRGRDEIYFEDDVNVRNLRLIALEESVGDLIVWIDRGENRGLNYMSLRDGSMSPVMIGDKRAGAAATIIDPYTGTLVGVEYGGEWDEQVFLVPELDAAQSAIEAAMPGKHVTITSWTADRKKVSVALAEAGRPADYFVYDSAAGTMGSIGSAGSHLVNRPVGNVVSISYEARDGRTIQGFVTLPPGKTSDNGPFPLVVLPHGGPVAHDTAEFDWWSGAYAEAGLCRIAPELSRLDRFDFGASLRRIWRVWRQDGRRRDRRCGMGHRAGHCQAGRLLHRWRQLWRLFGPDGGRAGFRTGEMCYLGERSDGSDPAPVGIHTRQQCLQSL